METIELPRVPRRRVDSHKGDYGKVLIIGGSETMIGAPALAALAACRSGAGLCRIATPKEILPFALTICPSATGFALHARDLKGLLEFADRHDAVAVGPGFGNSAASRRVVLELLERHSGPLVLDADALNILSSLEASEWPKRRNWSNVVLTPHAGEFMRLMGAVMKRGGDMASAGRAQNQSLPETPRGDSPGPGASSDAAASESPPGRGGKTRSLSEDDVPSTADGIPLEIDAESAESTNSGGDATPPDDLRAGSLATGAPDRSALAELLSRSTGCVVVLKGHRTVVAEGKRLAVNPTGNPAMATAGVGDVLTGVITALIGQGFGCAEAALLGVYVHGLAGDMAAEQIGPAGLLATDIIALLPRARATRLEAV
jgi:NAD(P)H-hydrate repair Nnr-like enzyme with NAD(P)H-hydrate dehydratase domain